MIKFIDKLEFHPLCTAFFDQMTDAEISDLAADIAKNGQHEIIRTHEGKILDGRNRYLACIQAKVPPLYAMLDKGIDPVMYVIGKNMHRRHLSESQRADVAAKIAKTANLPLKQSAAMMNVSERSVHSAARVQKHGVPELAKAVQTGKVSVASAAKVAEMKPAKQRKLVEKGPEAIVEATRPKAAKAAEPQLVVGSLAALIRNWDAAREDVRLDFKQRYGLMDATTGLQQAWDAADVEARAEHKLFLREEMRSTAPANGKTDQFGRPHAVPGTLLKGAVQAKR